MRPEYVNESGRRMRRYGLRTAQLCTGMNDTCAHLAKIGNLCIGCTTGRKPRRDAVNNRVQVMVDGVRSVKIGDVTSPACAGQDATCSQPVKTRGAICRYCAQRDAHANIVYNRGRRIRVVNGRRVYYCENDNCDKIARCKRMCARHYRDKVEPVREDSHPVEETTGDELVDSHIDKKRCDGTNSVVSIDATQSNDPYEFDVDSATTHFDFPFTEYDWSDGTF